MVSNKQMRVSNTFYEFVMQGIKDFNQLFEIKGQGVRTAGFTNWFLQKYLDMEAENLKLRKELKFLKDKESIAKLLEQNIKLKKIIETEKIKTGEKFLNETIKF